MDIDTTSVITSTSTSNNNNNLMDDVVPLDNDCDCVLETKEEESKCDKDSDNDNDIKGLDCDTEMVNEYKEDDIIKMICKDDKCLEYPYKYVKHSKLVSDVLQEGDKKYSLPLPHESKYIERAFEYVIYHVDQSKSNGGKLPEAIPEPLTSKVLLENKNCTEYEVKYMNEMFKDRSSFYDIMDVVHQLHFEPLPLLALFVAFLASKVKNEDPKNWCSILDVKAKSECYESESVMDVK